jgi:hypothetical protein
MAYHGSLGQRWCSHNKHSGCSVSRDVVDLSGVRETPAEFFAAVKGIPDRTVGLRSSPPERHRLVRSAAYGLKFALLTAGASRIRTSGPSITPGRWFPDAIAVHSHNSGARQCYRSTATTPSAETPVSSRLSGWRRRRASGSYAWVCALVSSSPLKYRPVWPSTTGDVARLRIACAPSSTVLNGVTPARRTMLVSM